MKINIFKKLQVVFLVVSASLMVADMESRFQAQRYLSHDNLAI
ncbi:hypothetical protein [Vibrio parahaemolyticus]|nr:hypothetical protein [Vibrio parahaemolyticus]